MPMDYQVRKLWQDVHYLFEEDEMEVSTEEKMRAERFLDQHADLVAAATQDDGYEKFLLAYISEQQRLFVEPEDGDEHREEKLCTCSQRGCPLKNQTLPHQIREADSVDAGIRAFSQTHRNGDPKVLAEAQDTWKELLTAATAVLRHTKLIMTDGVDEDEAQIRDVTVPNYAHV